MSEMRDKFENVMHDHGAYIHKQIVGNYVTELQQQNKELKVALSDIYQLTIKDVPLVSMVHYIKKKSGLILLKYPEVEG